MTSPVLILARVLLLAAVAATGSISSAKAQTMTSHASTSAGLAEGLPAPAAYSAGFLADRQQVVDVITSVASYADRRRWDLVKAAFAPRAVIDYSTSATASAGAGKAEPLSPEQIVSAWQTQLPGYVHTQHLVTNPIVTIDGDRARVISQVHATHFLPNDKGESYWTFVGAYDHELVRTPSGWRISYMRATKLFELGNPDLPSLATARVKAGEIATGQ